MLRSDQNSEISRREVLKSASGSVVAAGGLTGLSSSGAASQGEVEEKSIEGTDKKESIEATHQEPRVRSLLSVLGFPDIDDSASSVRKIQSGEITIISVKLVTEVGPIEFAKYGKSELNNIEAIFKLSDDVDHSSLHINVPDNDVLLIGESNGVVLSRKATKQEQRKVVAELPSDINVESSSIIAETSINGDSDSSRRVRGAGRRSATKFSVKVDGPDDQVTSHQVEKNSDGEYTLLQSENNGLTAQNHECDTKDWCWKCTQGTAVCAACEMACGGVSPACVACLVSACSAAGFACGECLECET